MGYSNKNVASLPGEIWKDVVGYEGLYFVSNFGRIMGNWKPLKMPNGASAYKRPCIKKLLIQNDGYLQVGLNMGARKRSFLVHRIVAAAFIPNPENKPEINHKNFDRADNRPDNLEWTDRQENVTYTVAMDRSARGMRSGIRKLTDVQVREIRASVGPYHETASKYGITPVHVGIIRRRLSWSHLPD